MYLGEDEFSHGVAQAVAAFAVDAHRAGGGLLGGVELAQVELNPRGPQSGGRAKLRLGVSLRGLPVTLFG